MRAYPLIFGFRELVAGNGFVAGVSIDGRALLKEEEDAWWIYGVEPGGISDYGTTGHEAYQEFRQSFREVLYDSAILAPDFDAFERDIRALCGQMNGTWAREWEQVREAIRSGKLMPQGDLVADLPKYTKDVKCSVEVVRLAASGRGITPTDNSSEEPLKTAA